MGHKVFEPTRVLTFSLDERYASDTVAPNTRRVPLWSVAARAAHCMAG